MKKIGLFLIISLSVMSCGDSDSENLDYELQLTENRSWPAANLTQLEATTVNGYITVMALQDTLVTVEITKECLGEDSTDAAAHISNIVISENINGGMLILEADMPGDDDRNYEADFDFSAPEDIYLDLVTVNGAVSVIDMVGGLDILITNGAITTQNLEGSIDGTTTNGAIDCDMALLGSSDSAVLTTTNGAVTLSLPANVSASFDAETTNGTVTVTGFTAVNYSVNETEHKAGTIGGGDATITIEVTNGDITIQAR